MLLLRPEKGKQNKKECQRKSLVRFVSTINYWRGKEDSRKVALPPTSPALCGGFVVCDGAGEQ